MAPRIITRITDVLIIPALSMQVCGKCFEGRLAVTSVCVPEGRGHGLLHLQPTASDQEPRKYRVRLLGGCYSYLF